MKYNKEKALFMIITIIMSMLSFISLNAPVVIAQNDEPDNRACCERTLDGEYCVFTDENQCDSDGLKQVGTTCENTNFCGTGCCFNRDDGLCSINTPKSLCLADGGEFSDDPTCQAVSGCQKGCCATPDGAEYVTQLECENAIKETNFNLNEVFDSSIDELSCNLKSRTAETGCCVLPDNQCSFTTGASCVELGGTPHSGVYCSKLTECQATPMKSKGCLTGEQKLLFSDDDNVHWFDSLGYPEQVVGTKYTGFVNEIQVLSNCDPNNPNINNLDCGFCDIISGSSCDEVEEEGQIIPQCVSLNCGTEHGDVFKWKPSNTYGTGWEWVESGNDNFYIQNYDSWCYYEGAVGGGRDLVGSRHHLFNCINGEIKQKEGDSRRNEICVMQFSEDSFGNKRPGAILLSNDAGFCLQYNQDDTTCGGECDNYNNDYDKAICCNKRACEESKDLCYWDGEAERCAPQASIGSSEGDTCDIGNFKCTSVWERKLEIKDILPGEETWECKKNCDCYNRVDDYNNFCISVGDCGTYYNIAGQEGFGHSFTVDKDGAPAKSPSKVSLDRFSNFEQPKTFLDGDKSGLWSIWSTSNRFVEALRYLATKDINNEYFNLERQLAYENFKGVGGNLNNPLVLVGGGYLGRAIINKGIFFGLGPFSKAFIFGYDKLIIPLVNALVKLYTGKIAEEVAEEVVKEVAKQELTEAATEAAVEQAAEEVGKEALSSFLIRLDAFFTILQWYGWLRLGIDLFNYFIYYKIAEVEYDFSCKPWLAPTGVNNCELCQNDPNNPFAVCGEYRCTSLGANCEYKAENPDGTTAESGLCLTSSVRDTASPDISPLKVEGDRQIIPEGTGTNTGYKIGGKFGRDKPVVLGVKTNERAACTISKLPNLEFESMTLFDNEKWQEEHTVSLEFTSTDPGSESIKIFGSGLNTYYVNCKDTSGNVRRNYKIEFEVSELDPIGSPIILNIDPKNNGYMPVGKESTPFYLLVDRPTVECKYSSAPNTQFTDMETSITCDKSKEFDPTGFFGYQCRGILESLKDNFDNTFYFKCNSTFGRVNEQDQPASGYHLFGTVPLVISDVGPEGDIYSNEVTLTATTIDGALKDGSATCKYAISEDEKNYNSMFEFLYTETSQHSHQLTLENGDYTVQIGCRDIAGNEDFTSINFVVDTPPLNIVHVEPNNTEIFTDNVTLKVVTTGGIDQNGDSVCDFDGLISGTFDSKETIGQETTHTKNLILESAEYDITITCTDRHKVSTTFITFEVNAESVPRIIRVYTQQTSLLNIITDQPSTCAYTTNDDAFNYEDGTLMTDVSATHHRLNMGDSTVFYIRCKDTRTERISDVYKVYP